MVDINKHRFYLVGILKDIFSDMELATMLGFKGGTALMFFHELPRFSVDLDFDLIKTGREEITYKKVRKILLNYGKIFDEAMKFYGPILVLDYGLHERKLKIEISNRKFPDRYEIRDLLGIKVQVMVVEDMFAHKLCALLDRDQLANRDIFDCWFFMSKQTPVNKNIVEMRMQMPMHEYLQACIDRIEKMSNTGMLQGLGDLMDPDIKKFVRTKLKSEIIGLLKFYKEYPIIS